MVYMSDREEIKDYIIRTNYNSIKNLKYYIHGYSVYSLEKILPSDIPIIIVDGQLSDLEAATLKNIKGKSCILVLGTGLTQIYDDGVKPDFFVVGQFSDKTDIMKNEFLNRIPMITSTSVEPDILHCHKGPKYFYWTGNDLERALYSKAKKSSAYIYQYDELMELSETNDLRDISMNLAIHMGASEIFLMGDRFDNFIAIEDVYDKIGDVTVHNYKDFSLKLIKEKCQVGYSLASITNNIIPFFDENGKKAFWEQVYLIRNQLILIAKLSKRCVGLYHDLYELSKQETVIKDNVISIVNELNANTSDIEKNDFINSVLTISQSIQSDVKIKPEVTDRDSLNEIGAVAVDGIRFYMKMQIISEEFSVLLTDIDCEDVFETVNTEYFKAAVPSILICDCNSQYDVLPYFAQELKKGFQQLKYNTYLTRTINHYQKTVGYDYILQINGAGIELTYDDTVLLHSKYMYDHKNTQRIALFVDHPITNAIRLKCGHRYIKAIFADRNWQKHTIKYWPQIKNAYFLPLGGIEQDEIVPFQFKEQKVVFFGSCRNLCDLENQINGSVNANLIWTIIKYLKQHVDKTIEEAINDIGTEKNCLCSLETMLLMTDVFMYVDEYVRQYFRQQVIWKIAESGLPIDLYGWQDDSIKMYSNVRIMDPVTMEQMLEICRHTCFVVNVQPWIKDGTQERVFNTMLAGSVAVTDVSKYLLEECEDQKHLLFYKLDDLEALVDKLTYYINNEPEAAKIAENGFELAKEKHTWRKRAAEMAEMLGMPTEIK